MNSQASRRSIVSRIRTYFLTGLIVLGPVAATGYIVWKLFGFVDHLLGTTLRGGYIRPGGVPGLGFLTVLLIIFVTGVLANNFLGRSLGGVFEGMVLRVPVFRGIYSTLKEVGEAIFSDKGSAFQRVVVIQFPSKGIFALAFVTQSSAARAIEEPGGRTLVGVFVPTVPNPTTGHLVFYPEEDLIPTTLRVEQAVKMIVSGGVVVPNGSQAVGARASNQKQRRKST